MSFRIIEGDCREVLASLESGSVQCCVTSPPYFGLRDYGVAGQIGLEPTPDAFVAELVAVFREVKRVLRDDGTLWLNLGDSYVANRGNTKNAPGFDNKAAAGHASLAIRGYKIPGKPKDLIGIPWRVAFALQADGWYLRSDIIWHKPNAMPESVNDRPTRAHEYLFLLSKSPRYYYDRAAIREPFADSRMGRDGSVQASERNRGGRRDGYTKPNGIDPSANGGANKRDVWSVATAPFKETHFATFPPKLIEPCILAGSKAGDVVLDPFSGAGTTGIVATSHGRNYIGIELNPEYAEMSRRRIRSDNPLFADEEPAA